MKVRQGLTFDDVLLVPKHSIVTSRGLTSLKVNLGKNITLRGPLVSANMKNVTEVNMGNSMQPYGLALLHRFAPIEDQVAMFKSAQYFVVTNRRKQGAVGCSVGVGKNDFESANTLVDAGCTVLCVDVAHGDHSLSIEMVERIARHHPGVLLIAGNVATAGGARRLHDAGADVIKVGVGGGSLCSTRIETGAGVPQLTALHDVFMESCKNVSNFSTGFQGTIKDTYSRKFKIIADGGVRSAGDCVKALCFSDAVMLGSILAGTDEAPGDVEIDVATGRRYKIYAGSSTHKASRVEGVVRRIDCKGPVEPILTKLCEGIQSGLSYQGCMNLEELKEDPEFIQISNAGLTESHPHTY